MIGKRKLQALPALVRFEQTGGRWRWTMTWAEGGRLSGVRTQLALAVADCQAFTDGQMAAQKACPL